MRNPLLLTLVSFLVLYSCTQTRRDGIDIAGISAVMVDTAPLRYIQLTDSLVGKIQRKDRLQVLINRQRAFSNSGMPDSALSTGVQIRELAGEYGDSLSMAKSLIYIKGSISAEQQRLFEPYLEISLRAFRREKMVYEQGVILGLMGFVQTREGNVAKAVEYLQEARKLLEPMDSARALYPVMLNLGNSYSALGQFTEAGEFSRRAFDCASRIKDSLRMAMALQNLAILFQSQQKSDSTIYYLKESERYVPASAGAFFPLQLRYNLADAYRTAGKVAEAKRYYQEVQEAFQRFGSQEGVAMTNRGLALLYGGSGAVGEAIGLMERSIRGLDSAGNRIQVAEQYLEMVDLYKKAGRFEEALEALTRQKRLNDSLFSEEKSLAVKELEVRYQTERKEEENRDLRAEVRWKNILSIGLVVILLLSGTLIWILRQRNRYSSELNRSYERLISRYILERDGPTRQTAHSTENAMAPVVTMEQPSDEPRMDSGEMVVLYERVMGLFQQEKLHLNADLSVEILAERLGLTPRKLAVVLKSAGETTYVKMVNQFRVAEASRLLEDPETSGYKMDVIARMSGFTNRQHFRKVFEQVTGVNPGYYREVRMQQSGTLPTDLEEN